MKNCLVFLLIPFLCPLYAQETRPDAPKIFLDCQWWCDEDYLKTELAYLNFMRDRADADIFVQQSALRTGSGGMQFTLLFYGQKNWSGQNDTLVFSVPPAASDNEQRQTLKNQLERGLLPYLLQTPLAGQISFQVNAPSGAPEAPRDPWNAWTFSVQASAEASGQESSTSFWMNSRLGAQRVTQRQKTLVYARAEINRERFTLDDNTTETYQRGGFRIGGAEVLALTDHWSYGFATSIGQSQYANQRLTGLLNAGLEYNLFPFREAATRQLAFRYRVGPIYNRYFEETIYFKTEEWLWKNSLSAAYRQVMPWGAFNMGCRAGAYLHDWSLHDINLSGGFELNLFKGFRLHFYGDFSILHNQVELSNGGASPQEVYLRVRQLKTNYNYYAWCSVSYTFGSIYSNVVNPRFNGEDGY